MSEAARLDGVSLRFGNGALGLDGIDLVLEQGAITGLVGESGSGKTTLCRVLAGLAMPSAGVASVGGQDVRGLRGGARRRFHRTVQMLLQDAPGSLSPRLTVRSLLAEPAVIHGLDRAASGVRVGGLMARLGLGAELLERYPHQLSGGQARRVAVARALLLEPRLLIADEPTAGLDPSVQGELLNLLQSLQAEYGLTMLISSHNLGVVRRIARTTVVMYLGQIVEAGATEAVFARPRHPYTAALVSAHPALAPAQRRARVVLSGEIPSVFDLPSGCRFRTRCPRADVACGKTVPGFQAFGSSKVRCFFPEVNNS